MTRVSLLFQQIFAFRHDPVICVDAQILRVFPTLSEKGKAMKNFLLRKRSIGLAMVFASLCVVSAFGAEGNKSLPGSPDLPHNRASRGACPKTAPYSVGGALNLFSFNDFKDLAGYEDFKCAVNWYMGSGVANAGQTWDTFAPQGPVTRWEVAMNLYRFFTILNEKGCDLADVADPRTQRYLPAVQQVCGAGIYGTIQNKLFHPEDAITVQDLLAWVYRAMNSSEAARKPGTHVDAGSLADLAAYSDAKLVSAENLPAVAGMIKAGYYTPKGKSLDPNGNVPRIDMVNLLYVLSSVRAPKTFNADAEARIKGAVYVDGGKKTIGKENLTASGENTSAIYAKNGAQVEVTDSSISSTSAMVVPSTNISEMGKGLAYRWGLDGAVVAAGDGTRIDIDRSKASAAGDGTDKGSYVLYALLGGTIHIKDSELHRDGYTSMATINGNLILENVKISGSGRTYSSDLGGGTITYKNVYSEKSGGQGGGGFMNDETTTGRFYNSTLKGDSYLSQSTGMARIYMKDTTVETGSGVDFRNNTSMPWDTAELVVDGGSLNFTNKCFVPKDPKDKCKPYALGASNGQRFIAHINGARMTLADGINLLHLTENAQARIYLKDVTVGGNVEVDPGSSAEFYLDHSSLTGKVSGNVKIIHVTSQEAEKR
jgi:hypothetical protein